MHPVARLGIACLLFGQLSACSFEPRADADKYHPCDEDGACPHPGRCECFADWVCVPKDPEANGPPDCFPDCGPGQPCADQGPCTTGVCDLETGTCTYVAVGNGSSCDDEDPCTMDDVCRDGRCVGVALDADGDGHVAAECPPRGDDCDDSDRNVHPDVFEGGDPDSGVCADGVDNDCDGLTDTDPACEECVGNDDCSDDNVCNGVESCSPEGVCQPGENLDCNDDNPCTDDDCDPAEGCQHPYNENPCDDNDNCTMNDQCRDGVCGGAPLDADGDGFVAEGCPPNGDDCNDGDDAINPNAFEGGGPGEPVCTDGIDNDCDGLTDTDPACSECSQDDDCDDDNVCNGIETCSNGACLAGVPMDCDDGNICTDDVCDPLTGCQHPSNEIACDDGDPCTMDDLCHEGVCKGVPKDEDADGYIQEGCTAAGDDCDDSDPNVNPGMIEATEGYAGLCTDGADNDCDGYTDCLDMGCFAHSGCADACGNDGVAFVQCNTPVFGDTSGKQNVLSWYTCVPWDETGGEQVYTLAAPEAMRVDALVTGGDGFDPDLFLLAPDCAQDDCIGYGDLGLSFEMGAGATAHLVVDGYQGQAGSFSLLLICSALVELCVNGRDDDLDLLTDCEDPDCETSPACNAANLCLDPAEALCGYVMVGDTSDPDDGNTDLFDVYGGGCGMKEARGPEKIWRIGLATDRQVSAMIVPDPGVELGLYVLQDCNPDSCIVQNEDWVDFNASDAVEAVLVVDGPDEGAGGYDIYVACDPETCDNGVDDDMNGFVDCADPDCHGSPLCFLPSEAGYCATGFDEDKDGATDCDDLECVASSHCPADGFCRPAETVSCGDTFSLSTAWPGATDVVNGYMDPSGDHLVLGGPEYAVVFRPAGSGTVNWNLKSAPNTTGMPPELLVLAGACHGSELNTHGLNSVSWMAEANTSYFLVMDAPEGTVASAQAVLNCAFEDCANGLDDDGDAQIDCDDDDCGPDWCPDGICMASVEIVCGGTATIGSNDRQNQILEYPLCNTSGGGYDPHPMGEAVWSFTPGATSQRVLVTLEQMNDGDNWLFVLQDDCDGLRCVDFGQPPFDFTAAAGRNYYMVLEQSDPGDAEITLACTSAQEDCFNGVDDDGDTKIDCEDTQCASDQRCDTGDHCKLVGGFVLQCGDWVLGDTGDGYSTDAVNDYQGDCGVFDKRAPEVAVSFVAEEDKQVTITLDHPDAIDLDLFLLEGNCTKEACVQHGDESLGFHAVRDRTYLVVIDAPEGNAGTFDLRVTCE